MQIQRALQRLFATGSFRGAVLTLLSGTSVSMVLAFFAQPVLTRLYTPSAFGLLDAFVALLSVLAPLASLRYEDAVMLPKREVDAANVLWLAVLLLVAFVVGSLAFVFGSEQVAALLGNTPLTPWLLLLPPALLGLRLVKLSEYWLTRQQCFRVISAGQVTLTLTTLATRIGAGALLVGAGAGGLIGGYLVGIVTAGLLYLVVVLRASGRLLRRAFSGRRIRQLARRYRRFPAFSAPSQLLSALTMRLPFLLLLYFFDEAVVGQFGRAFTVLAVPLSVVGGAVAQVFHVRAARLLGTGELPLLTARVHERLVLLGLFPALACMLAGPDVLAVVLGDAWRPAGLYLRYIAPWLYLAAVASPLSPLFDVLERQRRDFLINLVLFGAQTAALVAGGLTGQIAWTLLLIGVVGAAARLLHIALMLRLARVQTRHVLQAYGMALRLSLPFLVLVAASLPFGRPWLTALTVGVSTAGYYLRTARQVRLL